MRQAHEDGTPPMRPVFYDYPEDKLTWDLEDEFMFGPNLLVAPVMYAKMTERSVYLPAGKQWINVETGDVYEGGQTVTVPTKLESIPVFANCQEVVSYFKK